MIDILLDVHTHTIVSGHAFCTLNEMIAEAQRHHLTHFSTPIYIFISFYF